MRKIFKSIRRWWYVKILGKPETFVDLLDFFSEPKAPWNA
jgi:hypothetical protein